MKVHLIESAIERFITMQLREDNTDWYFPHGLVYTFHSRWTSPNSETLYEMYDACLYSPYSKRWWQRQQHRQKEMMQLLIKAEPELATMAWKDLANEAASLEGRLGRFEYYCNELLKTHRHQHPGALETWHQQDASMLSLYLAGLFPDRYTLYPGLDVFRLFCLLVGSPEIPLIDDLVRYMKIAKVVQIYLSRHAHYADLLELRRQAYHKEICIPYQMTYEVITSSPESVISFNV